MLKLKNNHENNIKAQITVAPDKLVIKTFYWNGGGDGEGVYTMPSCSSRQDM